MSADNSDPAEPQPTLDPADIYRAAREGVISAEDATRLVTWAYAEQGKHSAPHSGAGRGANTIFAPPNNLTSRTVACYLGALLMIAATNWLLGTKWEDLNQTSVLLLVLIYAALTVSYGRRLWRRGDALRGGLLVAVAVSQTPLIVYSIQNIFGSEAPSLPFVFFFMAAHPSWVVMEMTTIAVCLLALRRVRFPFLCAPLGYACLLLARDLPLLFAGYPEVNLHLYLWASAFTGFITLVIGRMLDRQKIAGRNAATRGKDLAFWPYLFGMLAVFSALSLLTAFSMLPIAAYLLASVGLIAYGVRAGRKTFLVFGALGLDQSLNHLAHLTFHESIYFPFVLVALGAWLLLKGFRADRPKISSM